MVFAKKKFGQHFLINQGIAEKIVHSLTFHNGYKTLLEVGPGTGVLTSRLVSIPQIKFYAIEIDNEAYGFLEKEYSSKEVVLIHRDFLKFDMENISHDKIGIIGNFPYNISSQIFFKVWDNRGKVEEVVGMVQKEVGKRIASPPGSKEYGILSVLLQAFYNIELLFEVSPGSFKPIPKVTSAVLRLTRNQTVSLDCSEVEFKRVVKQAFQNRRKTLWNALKPLNLPVQMRDLEVMALRAEQLDVNQFVELTKQVEEWKKM